MQAVHEILGIPNMFDAKSLLENLMRSAGQSRQTEPQAAAGGLGDILGQVAKVKKIPKAHPIVEQKRGNHANDRYSRRQSPAHQG